jgi:hypothetical protein
VPSTASHRCTTALSCLRAVRRMLWLCRRLPVRGRVLSCRALARCAANLPRTQRHCAELRYSGRANISHGWRYSRWRWRADRAVPACWRPSTLHASPCAASLPHRNTRRFLPRHAAAARPPSVSSRLAFERFWWTVRLQRVTFAMRVCHRHRRAVSFRAQPYRLLAAAFLPPPSRTFALRRTLDIVRQELYFRLGGMW